MKIGKLELIPVSDGTIWNDGGGAFGLVPKTTWEKLVPCDASNRIPMVLRCLLVRTPGATIVVETGLGDKVTPETAEKLGLRLERPNGGLLEELAAHGVAPGDVDIVLLTHLHADHSGGNTRLVDGRLVPTFPKARYWVQQQEWEDAHHTNERTRATYFGFNFDPLVQSGQLHLVNGDTPVTEGVRLVMTPGHTKGLQSVVIESSGESAVFLGDAAFFQWQIERLAWVSAYDLDPLTAIETKRRWQPWLVDRQALILFQHDPLMAAGRLGVHDKRFQVETVLKA